MKTYHADPNDHDAVAKALLEKYRDQETTVTIQQLTSAVLSSDFMMETPTSEISIGDVLEVAIKKLGLTAMRAPIRLDVGNGHFLNVTLEGAAKSFNLVDHLQRQQDFSLRTFGPGKRTAGLIDHIGKELKEIAADPHDLTEWVDVVMLSLDGAWRAGYEADEICKAIQAKLERNMARTWPDWRTAEPGKAIEHVRDQAV